MTRSAGVAARLRAFTVRNEAYSLSTGQSGGSTGSLAKGQAGETGGPRRWRRPINR